MGTAATLTRIALCCVALGRVASAVSLKTRILLMSSFAIDAARAAVSLTVNGAAATVRDYTASSVTSMVIDSGVVRFSFNSQLQGSGTWVNGSELLVGATGASFYVDAAGNNGLSPDIVRVVRLSSTLAEVALIDTNGYPLRHELRYIVRDGVPGVYAYHILSAVNYTSISEVRFNTRWNRCKLNTAYTAERVGIIPTGAFLDTQQSVQDSTWRIINESNNPSLACPSDNAGNVRPVYSKYQFSLYHSENVSSCWFSLDVVFTLRRSPFLDLRADSH